MNDFNSNTPDDFSDEIFDPQEQAERDRLKAQARKEREVIITCLGEQSLHRTGSRAAVTKTITGEKDNFKGELTYQYQKKGNTVEFTTLQYKITKYYGQNGGNKANINCSVFTLAPVSPIKAINSPDAMWQDGDWHNWHRTETVSISPSASLVLLLVTFIFDKSGPDPKTTVTDTTLLTDLS